MNKGKILKRLIVYIAAGSIGMSVLAGCSCAAPASAEVETSSIEETETTEIIETTLESPTEEPTEIESTKEAQGLVAIFSPGKYLNQDTFEVTKTQDQYDVLQSYDMTAETHYVEEIIEFIVCEINFRSEENVTNEDVDALIKQWAIDGKKVEDIDNQGNGAGKGSGGTDNTASYTIIPFGGTWYATTTVNIRRTPTTEEDNIVGQLAFAEAIEADGATSDARFVRIVYEGEYAFVSASLLQDTKPVKQTQPSNNGGSQSGNQDNQGDSGSEGGSSGGADQLPSWMDPSVGQGSGPKEEPDYTTPDRGGSFNGN